MMRRVPLAPRLTVGSDAGRDAARVRALAGTSDWRRVLLDRLGTSLVTVAGTHWLPSAPAPWPWPPLAPGDVAAAIGGARVEILAAAAPRQPGRRRLSLLARLTDPLDGFVEGDVVVKLGRPDDGLETEAHCLRLLTERPLPGIATPRVLDDGSFADGRGGTVSYLVTEPLGLGRQRPAIDQPLTTFEHDLGERLAALPRPDDTPDDHVPIHGDLAPWNLRRTDRGLALFDWEAAGWGASGSDLARYRTACDALRRR